MNGYNFRYGKYMNGSVFSSRFGDYYSFSPQFPVPTGFALQVSCFDWDIILPLLFLWNFVVSSDYTGTYNFPYISAIKPYNNKHYLHYACRYSTAGDSSLMWVWQVNTTLARYTWRAIKFCLRLWGMCIGINVYARSSVNVCFAIRVGFTFMKELINSMPRWIDNCALK